MPQVFKIGVYVVFLWFAEGVLWNRFIYMCVKEFHLQMQQKFGLQKVKKHFFVIKNQRFHNKENKW